MRQALAALGALAAVATAVTPAAAANPPPATGTAPTGTVASVGSAGPASTQLSAAQARQQAIAAARSQLGDQLATALSAQQDLADAMAANQAQRTALEAQLADTDAKLAELDQEIARLDAEQATTKRRIESERAEIRNLARQIYIQPSSYLLVFVESADLGDMLTRVSDLRNAGARADAIKVRLAADLELIQRDQARVADDRAKAAHLRDQQAQSLTRLNDIKTRQAKAAGDLAAQIDQTKIAIGGLDRESAAVAQQVVELLQLQQLQIISAAEQAVWDQASGAQFGDDERSKGHSTAYRFVWPEWGGTLTQPFGPSQYWFEPPYKQYPHFHTGADMSQGMGSDVHVVDDGLVVQAGCSCVNGQPVGYGNYVIVAHQDGVETLYGHLSAVLVKNGQVVTQGTVIGKEGSSGNSTGSHLHFEVRKNKEPIDPLPYLPPNGPNPSRA